MTRVPLWAGLSPPGCWDRPGPRCRVLASFGVGYNHIGMTSMLATARRAAEPSGSFAPGVSGTAAEEIRDDMGHMALDNIAACLAGGPLPIPVMG